MEVAESAINSVLTHRQSARVGLERPEVPPLGISNVAGSLHDLQHRVIEHIDI